MGIIQPAVPSRSAPVASVRHGFTMVEMLVVLTLMLVLAGLAVMFVPRMDEQARAARGAVLLQGWLSVAKQRALRDGAPRGIRLFPSAGLPTAVDSDTYAIEAQYLDQPDDIVGVPSSILIAGTAGTSVLTLSGIDNTGGWQVQSNDYVELLGTGLVHRINTVNATASPLTLNLASNLPISVTASPTFRIIRAARVSGEEKLMLPDKVGIDLGTVNGTSYTKLGNTVQANSDGTIDILFAPSGNVIGTQLGAQVVIGGQTYTDRVVFWVRDYSIDYTQGEPSLIATFMRSGLVASVPVNPSGSYADPYNLTLNP